MSLLPPPIILLSLEFMTTALAVGFTDPYSPLRLACLPLMIAANWVIVTTSIEHMRSPWAALMGGYGSTYLLLYITIGLLCKRSYSDHTIASPPAHNNENIIKHNSQNPIQRPTPTSSSWARLRFSIQAASSFHWNEAGTTNRVSHHSASTTTNSTNGTSKSAFFLRSAATITICYLTLDFLSLGADPSKSAALFAPEKIPLLTRLHEVTCSELVVRLFATLVSGICIYAVQQGLESLLASLSVAVGLSEVEEWSPRFGPVTNAWSLRRFWGYAAFPTPPLLHSLISLTRISSILIV